MIFKNMNFLNFFLSRNNLILVRMTAGNSKSENDGNEEFASYSYSSYISRSSVL